MFLLNVDFDFQVQFLRSAERGLSDSNNCYCYYCCCFHLRSLTGRRKEVPQRAAKHRRDPQARSHISTQFFFIYFYTFFIFLLNIFYILQPRRCRLSLLWDHPTLQRCSPAWLLVHISFVLLLSKTLLFFNSKIAPLVKTLIIFSIKIFTLTRFCEEDSLLCGIYAYLFYSIMGCIVFLQVTN